MKYICAQPATLYYAWQIDAMLFSFRTVGVNLEDVHVVCAIHGEINSHFDILMRKYPGVIFSFYEDNRSDKSYISSIRPYILKKHFEAYKDLSEEVLFYHDCDIVFTKPIKMDQFTDDDVCYLSDTISYIGYNYIKSKGEDVFKKMIDIVGIDEKTVIDNQNSSGGAQYILKGIDKYFWHDVEKDAVRLFKEVTQMNVEKKQEDPNYHEIQIWCADMWAVLWNLWKRNKETIVTKDMDFSWATTHADQWHKNAIYHNAGVTNGDSGMFYKGMFINKIPELSLVLKTDKCSYKYYKILQQALQ